MFQYNLLTLLFSCFVIPFGVSTGDTFQLQKQIVDMRDHQKVLGQEYQDWTEKFMLLKKQCDDQLRPLQEKHELLEGETKEKAKVLESVVNLLHQRQVEEQQVMDALNRQYVIHNKYAFQVELHQQEYELLTKRKMSGIADKCHQMKPLFTKYANQLSVRSFAKRPLASEKDAIITLENDLNTHKLKVQELQNRNKALREEIEKYGKICDGKIKDLQQLTAMTEEKLKETLSNIDLVKLEVQEVEKNIEVLQEQLGKITQATENMKEKSLKLKEQIRSFEDDKDCYKRISDLNILYTPKQLT